MKSLSVLLFSICLANSALAAPLVTAYETGLDQEIVAAFPAGPGEAIFITKKYLGQRKANVNPERAKSVSLEITDSTVRGPIAVAEIDSKQEFSVGRPIKVADGFLFVVTYGSSRFDIFKYSRSAREARALDTTALRKRVEDSGGAFEKVFLVDDGLIVIRADVGVRWASYVANDGRKPFRLETMPVGDNGRRLLSIDDVVQVGDRLNMVASVSTDSREDRSEVWVFNFDKTLTRAAATISRLELGRIMSSQSGFVPTQHEFPSVQVISRTSQTSAPTVSLFSLKAKPALVWSYVLPRAEGMRDVTLAGACNDSYIVAKRMRHDKGSHSDVEFIWVDAKGSESAFNRQTMVEVGSVLNMGFVAVRSGLLSFVNFSKIEDLRRPDGWYSWTGFRVDALNTENYCHGMSRCRHH